MGDFLGEAIAWIIIAPFRVLFYVGHIINVYLSREPPPPRPQARPPPEEKQLIPVERFEHTLVVAPTGHGKTSGVFAGLIWNDLWRVADGQTSLVVIDSQRDLINTIAHNNLFAHELKDKLILIEPDIEHPLALNVFDMGKARLKSYSKRDQERLTNSATDLLTYIFGGLLGEGSAFTAKQTALWRYAIRLLMAIDGATIRTFVDLLAPNGEQQHQAAIDTLDEYARLFFATQWNDKQFAGTKQEVMWRLMLMLENQTFATMFGAQRTRLDLYAELSKPKVILINSDKALLGAERSAVFARFWIACLMQATFERADITHAHRFPVHVYVDEAQEILDANVATMLGQARKYNVGMHLAVRELGHFEGIADQVLTNTAIKIAAATNHADSVRLARAMHCLPENFGQMNKNDVAAFFAVFVRNQMPKATKLGFELGLLENKPKLSNSQYRRFIAENRARYAVQSEAPAPKPEPQKPHEAQPAPDAEPEPVPTSEPVSQAAEPKKPPAEKSKQPAPTADEMDTAPQKW